MAMENAVMVRNAKKGYGGGVTILNGLNINVPRGCIYSLLGSSGCGKTTLLSCVVGVRKLDSGDIWVLGGKPGTKECGIPGPRIGYMPQEVSLIDEFSTFNALCFFGKISGMEEHEIEDRYMELKELLQLPPRNRFVRNMSGGQQRRTSFAAALLHKPELLILDEPTVGLDPVLRDNIWNHLVKITKEEGVTVIITTHYIEEAKQSDRIGLLRNGQLLAESSPNELLTRFQTDSLEEAFLNLSQQQQEQVQQEYINPICSSSGGINPNSQPRKYRSNWKIKCTALLYKNLLQFIRHPGGFLFSIVLPLLQMLLFYNAIGPDPKNLKLYVVNDEAGRCDGLNYLGNITYYQEDRTCKFTDLSCRFIAGIDEDILEKKFYDNYEQAKNKLNDKRDAVGIMHFKKNFSLGMQDKVENMFRMSEDLISAAAIHVTLLTPNRELAYFALKELYKMFNNDFENIIKECGLNKKYAHIPIKFEKPIYGDEDQNYGEYVTPVFLLTLLFFLPTSVSSSTIITDRDSGIWNRILVQGVTTTEILLTHLISQFIIIVIQVSVVLILSFGYYDMDCEGSMFAIIAISILSGLCGMVYGFFISVSCSSHVVANYATLGSFYPLVLLCGMIWPIEGMPKVIKWFSLSLPLTVPGNTLREIMHKGTNFDNPNVYSGFLVISAWILALLSICLFQLKKSN